MINFISKRFHLIIDGWNCNPVVLDDKEKLEQALKDLVDLCGMKILHGPVVSTGVSENPGLTGFVTIDFSHISIHTFTKTKEICIDVFSCKQFDYEKIKSYVKKTFNLEDQFTKFINVKHESY